MEQTAPFLFLRRLAWLCAGIFAVSASFALVYHPASAGRIEAGTFTAHDTFDNQNPVRVTFQQPFDTPPIVVALPSQNGNNSASIRITNVGTDGFDELILEPDNWDGRHIVMTVPYVAIEPGRHVLPDGTVIEAGFSDISNVQFGSGFTGGVASFANVNFSSPLASIPMILHQIQTANSETRNVANQSSRPHITSLSQNPTTFGFQLALERSQANSGPFPSTERVGWIALPNGTSGSFPNTAGTSINWASSTTSATIRGWDDGCFPFSHGQSGGNPIVIAKKATRNNGDGGWLRYCTINGTTISLRVDEDRDQDNERGIATGDAESAAILSFSQSFHANLAASLDITKLRTSTDDGAGSAFATPDAIVTYLITVTNSGNAPPNLGTVIVTEELPAELDLVVADFGGPGSGPIAFANGSPPAGMTCGFTSFASTTDCYSFSTDGVDFTYTPADSGDGTDPNVRYVRAQPSGFMNGDTGSGDPQFTLNLRARIR
ncbi:MAG: hypothetical protein AAGL10_04040 [Pseudomonadota bacterium]